MATEEAVKKATAGIMSLIAGIIILINGIGFVPLIGITLSEVSDIPISVPGILALLATAGITLGFIVIIGAILIYIPGKEVIGGTLVIISSFLSIVISGGFVIGLILGIIGGRRARKLDPIKSLQLESLETKVAEVILPNRISTGTKKLDSLLLGGIPERYAVALTGPPSDERELLIKRFLEAGAKEGQITFDIRSEAAGRVNLVEDFQASFFLFLCNPKPKTEVSALPNVYGLRSKTDLTNLNIALAKALQTLDQSMKTPKRICIESVSDILLHHKADTTRKWLSETISNLSSRGFIFLIVMNPLMHPPEELHAILDLLDGEISIDHVETKAGPQKRLQIKNLRKKEYNKNPVPL
jgi:KaiC/GvpD/RAD55 family RecA-like ATPase